jgi:hypothetical protein
MNVDQDLVVELFSGDKPFSQVAPALGYRSFTVDKDPQFKADLVVSVGQIIPTQIPPWPHFVWAAPASAGC